MSQALGLAKQGLFTADPNPRVGCVLTKNGVIIGEGWHQYTGSAHAEREALNQLARDVAGADCYITLEPCCHQGRTPPCVDALIEAQITRAFIAMLDPNPQVNGQSITRLRQANIAVSVGLLGEQASTLNQGFVRRMEKGMPYVRSKLAMSLDGKTALANGRSRWITSSPAREDVHFLRCGSSAVVTGIGTVLADDPALNVRGITKPHKAPFKVVLDSDLETPVSAKLLQTEGDVLIMTLSSDEQKQDVLTRAGAKVVQFEKTSDREIWLKQILGYLAKSEQINEVLIEAGAKLSGSFIKAGLVDELIIYMAPTLLGHDAKPLLYLPMVEDLSKCFALHVVDLRQVGKDIRITAKPNYVLKQEQ